MDTGYTTNMITLEEGSEEAYHAHKYPYVKVTIEPGYRPFTWWYEVHIFGTFELTPGSVHSGWQHAIDKDGGAIGLWRCWKKANEALHETWFEVAEEQKKTVCES